MPEGGIYNQWEVYQPTQQPSCDANQSFSKTVLIVVKSAPHRYSVRLSLPPYRLAYSFSVSKDDSLYMGQHQTSGRLAGPSVIVPNLVDELGRHSPSEALYRGHLQVDTPPMRDVFNKNFVCFFANIKLSNSKTLES